MTISKRKAPITQCFCIFINALNCLDCSNDLLLYTTLTTLSIGVVSDGSKSSNGPGFYGKSTGYLQTPLYDPGLKILLGLDFKIVITGCVYAITTISVDIRPFNILG